MGDIFKEQLVKRQPNLKTTLVKVGIVVAALFLILVAYLFSNISIINLILPLIVIGVVAGAYFLFTMQNIEYEYIYTNGELDIDCIVNKSRRKRVFSSDIRTIEIMAHIDDNNYKSEFNNVEKVLDFSSGVTNQNTYVAKMPYQNKQIKLIIEPNENLQNAMSQVLTPRKFHLKK